MRLMQQTGSEGCEMSNENEPEEEATGDVTKQTVFVQGFLVRFVLGGAPIGLIGLIKPDFRPLMMLTLAWFFVVCIIAAGLDVKRGRRVAFNLRRVKLKPRIIVILILVAVSVAWMALT